MTKPSILLVEDETLLCWVLEDALVEFGHDVRTATTGNGGINALETGQPFDALVTNIRLVDGPDRWALARKARELDPTIGVLYVSGDTAAQHKQKGVQGSLMLAKPFEPDRLYQALASLIASRL